MTSLPLGGMAQGQALAINDQNEVVGSVSDFSGDVQQAVLWSNGILSNLGINGTAALINNQSQILIEQNIGSLLLYDNGQMTPATALSNSVYAINDTGQFVRSSVGSVSIWQDGNEYFLPNLPGTIRTTPWGINDASQVVGYSNLGDGRDVATLWQNGSVFDLNNLIDPGNGWILNDATDIAQDGSIVGTGSFEGQPEIFILTPTAPEPATLGIIGAGAFLITRRRRGGSITS
jgi:probable HAF family extracellular repeat protein